MIGKVLNAEDKSGEIIDGMKQTVTDVQNAVKGLDKPSVYYVVGYGEFGDYTATGETFIASMLDMAGGNNIAADVTGWVYSLEKLMEKDPQIILCSEEAKKVFQQTNGYKELTAVKEGHIYVMDENILQRQGPRLALGLKEMAKILHPESFK
jgi:iron complex transport system substrate-binding protein